jgi:hypothetical protein
MHINVPFLRLQEPLHNLGALQNRVSADAFQEELKLHASSHDEFHTESITRQVA